jgi:ferredoxin-NADP reductase
MLHDLARRESAREIWWIHTARDPAEHVFEQEARRCLSRLPGSRAVTFYTRAQSAVKGSITGRPTSATLRELGIPLAATAYVCGPAGFIDDVTTALAAVGLEPARIPASSGIRP